MKTLFALVIKFIITMAAAWIAFMVFDTASLWVALMIAVVVTVLNFLIGDRILLSRFGNIVSAIIDGIMGGAIAWIVLNYTPQTYYSGTSVYIFAAIVAATELFFHRYLLNARVVKKKKSNGIGFTTDKPNYGTESGSELYPYSSMTNDGYNKGVNRSNK